MNKDLQVVDSELISLKNLDSNTISKQVSQGRIDSGNIQDNEYDLTTKDAQDLRSNQNLVSYENLESNVSTSQKANINNQNHAQIDDGLRKVEVNADLDHVYGNLGDSRIFNRSS